MYCRLSRHAHHLAGQTLSDLRFSVVLVSFSRVPGWEHLLSWITRCWPSGGRGLHFYSRRRLIIARLVRQNWPARSFRLDNYREISAINFALGILSWILNRILIRKVLLRCHTMQRTRLIISDILPLNDIYGCKPTDCKYYLENKEIV